MLQAAGHDVVGIDNGLFSECLTGPPVDKIPALQIDLRDIELEHLDGIEAVIHLAGLSNDPLGNFSPACTYDINHAAAERLARLSKEAGVQRFLFSSSCSIYGNAGDTLIDESATVDFQTPYGRSKYLAEKDISKLADDNFSPTYLRNATAYGVSSRLRGDLVVNNLVGYAVTTGEVLLKSDGSPWRPLVHIEDIARAFVAAIEAPRECIHDEVFNVGSTDENYRIADIADIVVNVVPDSWIRYAIEPDANACSYRVDFSKIHAAIPGFKCRWNVLAGVEELCGTFQTMNLDLDTFLGSRYLRIKHVHKLLAQDRITQDLRWSNGVGT
jgi:nucleoside-diphosphate-sugar epimerase